MKATLRKRAQTCHALSESESRMSMSLQHMWVGCTLSSVCAHVALAASGLHAIGLLQSCLVPICRSCGATRACPSPILAGTDEIDGLVESRGYICQLSGLSMFSRCLWWVELAESCIPRAVASTSALRSPTEWLFLKPRSEDASERCCSLSRIWSLDVS